MNRVVITGAGCVTAIGVGLEDFSENLFQARQGFSLLPGIEPGDLQFQHAAQVLGFNASSLISPPSLLTLSERSSQFALVAAAEAVRAAKWESAPDGVATILGCSAGGRSVEEPATAKLYTSGGRVHPLMVPRSMASSGTSLIALRHGFTGPAFTLSTACASGSHAIGLAFQMVRSGAVQAALTGGHEAPLTYGFLKAWDSLRAVSPGTCRPFSVDRDGMSLGEGAAMLVLETLEHALQRGAHILCEIVGFGMSCDAHHMTQPTAKGPASAMRAAMQDAGITPAQVGYINAHGTGTLANDSTEAEAIRSVFAGCETLPPVSSTKSMHGHAIGASGAMEALATVVSLQQQMVPGTAGTTEIDPSLRLDVVTGKSRTVAARFALSNSFAFGGLNAVLAFRAFLGETTE